MGSIVGMPGRIRHAACAWRQYGALSLFEEMKNLSGAVYRHVAVNGSLYGRRRLKPSAFDRGIVISGHVQELAVIAVQADDTSRFRSFSRIRLTRPGRFPQPLS